MCPVPGEGRGRRIRSEPLSITLSERRSATFPSMPLGVFGGKSQRNGGGGRPSKREGPYSLSLKTQHRHIMDEKLLPTKCVILWRKNTIPGIQSASDTFTKWLGDFVQHLWNIGAVICKRDLIVNVAAALIIPMKEKYSSLDLDRAMAGVGKKLHKTGITQNKTPTENLQTGKKLCRHWDQTCDGIKYPYQILFFTERGHQTWKKKTPAFIPDRGKLFTMILFENHRRT